MNVSENDHIQLILKTLPNKPGVYQFFDKSGTIIYVGKAKSLKNRVRSYFLKNTDSGKTRLLVKHIQDVQYIVVDSELDALLLENNLIKEYQPKFNIQLKDDKTYPWICVKNEPFPRIFKTRRVIRDGSKYYGPYPSVFVLNTLLDLIKEIYPLRNCSLDLKPKNIQSRKYKVCLEYHLGNCKGACEQKETEAEYDAYIHEIDHILKGNVRGLINSLKAQMNSFAAAMKFEEAQALKTKIDAIERYRSKSTVVSAKVTDVDVISIHNEPKTAFVNYLVIRDGAIVHGITTEVNKRLEESDSSILQFVLPVLRERFNSASREVLIEKEVDFELNDISFHVPLRGDKKALIDLSLRNVKFYRLEKLKQEKIKHPERHTGRILEQIKKDFRLAELPIHIECFDNSNFQGTNAVSACVVFKNAKPSKKDYRHFNIKTVEGPDDFASMEEAVYRRYHRLLNENQDLPQLIVIDGGKGQLSAALKALDMLELRGKIAIVGIAKKLEEIFFPGDSLPLYIDKRSESLKVIQHMRNEAHRFGITHHRNKRSKASLQSELTSIPGIGERTQEELIRNMKSINRIKAATLDELSEHIGEAKAKIVHAYFNAQK